MFLSVVVLGFATWLIQRAILHREPPLPTYRTVTEFTLQDQTGAPFSAEALRGKVWLASFIYTECPGPCLGISRKMSELQRAVPKEVHLVSFSLDPEHDTPEVLSRYSAQFQSGPNWHFLTGQKATIRSLATGPFMLAAADAPAGAEEPIIHSTKIVLVDRSGTVRAYYESSEVDPARVAADARRLLGNSR
jgi:protein SCO1/2